MDENFPQRKEIQKEFGEIERLGNHLAIFKYGTNEAVGEASIAEPTRPFPHIVLLQLDVYKAEQRGKGFASQLMEEVERMSRESGKPVVLCDVTAEDGEQNPKAVGMYGKRPGWTRLQSSGGVVSNRYVYGTTDPELLEKFYEMYA